MALAELDALTTSYIDAIIEVREGRKRFAELDEHHKSFRYILSDAMTASKIAAVMEFFPVEDAASLSIRSIWNAVTGGVKKLLTGDFFRFPWLDSIVNWLLGKRVVTVDDLRRIEIESRQATAGASNMESREAIDAIRQKIQDSIDKKQPIEQFRLEVEDLIDEIKQKENLVYWAAIKKAYLDQFNKTARNPKFSKIFPYVQYIGIPDKRIRPWHFSLHEMITEVGSPLYQLMMLAQGQFNCRCKFVPLKSATGKVYRLGDVPEEMILKILDGKASPGRFVTL